MSTLAALPPSSALSSGRPFTGLRSRSRSSIRSRYRKQTAALMVAATLGGLWFGVAAPSVSPVTPASPPPISLVAVDPANNQTSTTLDPASSTSASRAAGDGPHGHGLGDGGRSGGDGRGGQGGHR